MNKKTFSAVALATLLLTACQNDEETMQTDARVALQVTSGIQTRAYDDQWEENDDIGIFGFTQGDAPTQAYSNVRYVTKSGNGMFTPDGTTIYLPTDDSYLDFVAYYPHTTDLENGIYTVDVENQSDQSTIDLGKQTVCQSQQEYGGVQLRAQAVENCPLLRCGRWHSSLGTYRNEGATDQPADPRHFRRDAARR